MADLQDVLGAVLASLARARQTADRESAAIAEQYRAEPLLAGMSVPRVRVAELTLDLPVLIETHEPAEPAVLAPPTELAGYVVERVVARAAEHRVPMNATVRRQLTSAIAAAVKSSSQDALSSTSPADVAARATESALRAFVEGARWALPAELEGTLRAEARRAASERAVARPARAATLRTTVATGEVKERGGPANVTRLKITLREEGLEWATVDQPDGTRANVLSPE